MGLLAAQVGERLLTHVEERNAKLIRLKLLPTSVLTHFKLESCDLREPHLSLVFFHPLLGLEPGKLSD